MRKKKSKTNIWIWFFIIFSLWQFFKYAHVFDWFEPSEKKTKNELSKKDLDKKEEIQKIANTTKNLFVGSTTELQKLLKNGPEIKNVTPEPK